MTTIFVVDDNEQNQYLLNLLLKGHGYDVVLLNNGIEALDAARKSPPSLIISDILMPGMDGFGLCRQWKTDEQLKEIPFIFYTATYTDPKDEDFALSLGAERFIRKPADVNVFTQIIKEVLGESKKKKSKADVIPATEEVFFKKYNEALIRKMEDKMLELEQMNKRLATLFQTSADLISEIPQQELIAYILEKTIAATECTHAFYFKYLADEKMLQMENSIGFSQKENSKMMRTITFKLGEEKGMVGLVGKSHDPSVVNDDFSDPFWKKKAPSARSALFLASVYEKKLIGVWGFLSDIPQKFNEKIVRDLITIINNVTVVIEKNQLFEKIKQSERRYRTLVESSIDAIITIDKMGMITDWSKGAEEIFEYTKEDCLGKAIAILVPDEKKEWGEQILDEIQERGFKNTWDFQLLTKTSQLLDVELTSTYLGDELGFTMIIRNITKRKQEERFMNALNKASISTATALTPKAIFTTMSAQLSKLDLLCMLLQIDSKEEKIFSNSFHCGVSSQQKEEDTAEMIQENFTFPISTVTQFSKVIQERESIFIEKPDEILGHINPKYKGAIPDSVKKYLENPRIIIAPLIAEEIAIGIFMVQSKNLTKNNIPTITAFANQLAAAWAKARLTMKLQQTMNGIIHAIALIVEMRDPYTAGHQKRVGDLAAAIASEMKLSRERTEGIRIAGIIHDLGKITVPAEILSKPGKLSAIEYNLVKMHPQVGFDILKGIEFPWPLAQVVFQHHERMDGSGYPQGLNGEDIILEARIIAVADVVEAMSSHRPYRPALGFSYAKEEIIKNRGILYDAAVVDACVNVFKKGYTLPEGEK